MKRPPSIETEIDREVVYFVNRIRLLLFGLAVLAAGVALFTLAGTVAP